MTALPIVPARSCTLHLSPTPFRCPRHSRVARVAAHAHDAAGAEPDRRAALSGLAAAALAVALPSAARAEDVEAKIKEVRRAFMTLYNA